MILFLQETLTNTSYDLASPLLCTYPKELNTAMQEKKIKKKQQPCKQMFAAALVTIAKKVKTTKCPSTAEGMSQVWSIHTTEYHPAVKRNEVLPHVTMWLNLENSMLGNSLANQWLRLWIFIAIFCKSCGEAKKKEKKRKKTPTVHEKDARYKMPH